MPRHLQMRQARPPCWGKCMWTETEATQTEAACPSRARLPPSHGLSLGLDKDPTPIIRTKSQPLCATRIIRTEMQRLIRLTKI
jgi:hypothetical protein